MHAGKQNAPGVGEGCGASASLSASRSSTVRHTATIIVEITRKQVSMRKKPRAMLTAASSFPIPHPRTTGAKTSDGRALAARDHPVIGGNCAGFDCAAAQSRDRGTAIGTPSLSCLPLDARDEEDDEKIVELESEEEEE